MPSSTNAELESRFAPSNLALSYMDNVIGAAFFDLSGLPKEYFTTSETGSMSWVQTIFQALGLRSLLVSSLQLEGFHHVAVQSNGYCALVVKQRSHYTALLFKHQEEELSDLMIEWAQNFQPSMLQEDSRFRLT